MAITSINNEEEYQQALDRLFIIFDAKPNTSEGDELSLLADLIDEYEGDV